MIFDFIVQNFPYFMKIIIAAILGGIIGLERDIHGRAAGLRTHLLVSIGASLFMILSVKVSEISLAIHPANSPVSDPGRIAAQIVTGIGFIGAGAIIKEGFNIRGLTTAACLWVVAAIGMASGLGNYFLAVSTTIIALLALIILNLFERHYKKYSYRSLTISFPYTENISKIINILKQNKIKIMNFDCEKNYDNKTTTIKLKIRMFHKGITDKHSHIIINDLESNNIKIKCIKWDHRE